MVYKTTMAIVPSENTIVSVRIPLSAPLWESSRIGGSSGVCVSFSFLQSQMVVYSFDANATDAFFPDSCALPKSDAISANTKFFNDTGHLFPISVYYPTLLVEQSAEILGSLFAISVVPHPTVLPATDQPLVTIDFAPSDQRVETLRFGGSSVYDTNSPFSSATFVESLPPAASLFFRSDRPRASAAIADSPWRRTPEIAATAALAASHPPPGTRALLSSALFSAPVNPAARPVTAPWLYVGIAAGVLALLVGAAVAFCFARHNEYYTVSESVTTPHLFPEEMVALGHDFVNPMADDAASSFDAVNDES
jgi:hypothetical protein